MEKIKLFKKRNFGEVIGVSFELLRQNFKLISMSFLVIILPLIILSLLSFNFGFVSFLKQNASSISGSSRTNIFRFTSILIGYIGYIITLFVQAVVLHELVIAYEHSDDPENIKVSDVWLLIRADMGRIIGSFFGLFPFWMVMGIIASLIYGIFASISSSMAGLWILIMYIGYIYIYVCQSNYLMLRLRSEYTVFASFTKSITLTFGEWRWWRTLGVHFIMALITFSFYSVSLIPFGIVVYLYSLHVMPTLPRDQVMMIAYVIVGVGTAYAGIVFSFCWNLVLLGSTVNYYSLVEEKEHVGLQVDIEQLGMSDTSIKLQEGEY